MNFTKTLTHWYSINKREMPWRLTKDPYKIWLSEIILQQTQIKQGLPYYKAFVKSYPSVQHLAETSEEEVLKLWQGLGYYSRARNLHFTAKSIVADYKGEFPNNYQDLLKLKGIGDYTASAITSICFSRANAVVDGNVYRVLSRFFGIKTPINSTTGIKEFKAVAQKLIDKNNPGDYNQAIMEFGAIQCKPNNPDCNVCPLQNSCIAYNQGIIDKLPVKLKKLKVKKKYFNYIVIISKANETVIQQRTGKGIWQNLYEFPLIESDKNLSEKALINDDEFKGIVKQQDYKIKLYNKEAIVHKLSHLHLHTKFWIVEVNDIVKESIPVYKVKKYPLPVLINNFVEEFVI